MHPEYGGPLFIGIIFENFVRFGRRFKCLCPHTGRIVRLMIKNRYPDERFVRQGYLFSH